MRLTRLTPPNPTKLPPHKPGKQPPMREHELKANCSAHAGFHYNNQEACKHAQDK